MLSTVTARILASTLLFASPWHALAMQAAVPVANPGPVGIGDTRPPAPPDVDLTTAREFDCATAGANPPVVMMIQMERIQPQVDYANQLSEWYGRRFQEAGVWTQAQADDFAVTIPDRPETVESMRSIDQVNPILEQDMATVNRLSQNNDNPAACRALMTMLNRMPDMANRYRRLWAGIDAIYRAEARRLNVPLP